MYIFNFGFDLWASNPSPEATAFREKLNARRKACKVKWEGLVTRRDTPSPELKELVRELGRDDGDSFAAFFTRKFDWLYGAALLERHRPALNWALEHIREYPYTVGLGRRALRSGHISCHFKSVLETLISFYKFCVIDADICDILTYDLPADAAAYAREYSAGVNAEWLAYEIDSGNGRLIKLLKSMLNDEPGAIQPSPAIFRGILRAHDTELYQGLVRLLLAARLQEGLRQAICEAADEGTLEGFLVLLRVIKDNDLIRFSSVKRAFGVWLGFAA